MSSLELEKIKETFLYRHEFDEDAEGRPFIGRSGKLLDNMIKSIGLEREDVYIMNTVKCRPPGNANPLPEQLLACRPYFTSQLLALDPKVIALLGSVAMNAVLGPGLGITKRCGNWEELEVVKGKKIKAMPCFHPAALLRNPGWKEPAWDAFQKIKEELSENS